MGLYDVVRTNFRLPDIEINENLTLYFNRGNLREFGYETEFQTKDFDCALDQYLISSRGRLFIKNGLENEDTNYHGMMSFYTSIWPPIGGGYFIEFHAKFTDGKLVQVGGECLKSF